MLLRESSHGRNAESLSVCLSLFPLLPLLTSCLMVKVQTTAYRWETEMKMSGEITEVN